MLEVFPTNEPHDKNDHLSLLGPSEPKAYIRTAQCVVNALLTPPSITTLPAIQINNQIERDEPSPWTVPSISVQSQAFYGSFSARRVEYDVSDTRVVIGVPAS